MKLTCETCGHLQRETSKGENFCKEWCFTIFDDDKDYRKTSEYFCAEHTLGPGMMTKVHFEDKDQMMLEPAIGGVDHI